MGVGAADGITCLAFSSGIRLSFGVKEEQVDRFLHSHQLIASR